MSDEKDFKEKFEKASHKAIKDNAKKLYPVSDKDIDIIKGDKSESGTNSYAKNNQSAIVKLKNIKTQPFSKYADFEKRGF